MHRRSYQLNHLFQKQSVRSQKDDKQSLRSFYREKINNIPPTLKKQKQEQIVYLLNQLSFWKQARGIAVYRALKDEPCLSSFYKLWEDKICFPVIQNRVLKFYKNRKNQWRTNQFQISEPAVQPENYVPVDDISVFLVPGQVFDRRGGRLGRGWGYYDKTLIKVDKKQKAKHCEKILFIGIAFTEQVHNEPLALFPHDVLMDILVTDSFILMPLDQKAKGKKSFKKSEQKIVGKQTKEVLNR